MTENPFLPTEKELEKLAASFDYLRYDRERLKVLESKINKAQNTLHKVKQHLHGTGEKYLKVSPELQGMIATLKLGAFPFPELCSECGSNHKLKKEEGFQPGVVNWAECNNKGMHWLLNIDNMLETRLNRFKPLFEWCIDAYRITSGKKLNPDGTSVMEDQGVSIGRNEYPHNKRDISLQISVLRGITNWFRVPDSILELVNDYFRVAEAVNRILDKRGDILLTSDPWEKRSVEYQNAISQVAILFKEPKIYDPIFDGKIAATEFADTVQQMFRSKMITYLFMHGVLSAPINMEYPIAFFRQVEETFKWVEGSALPERGDYDRTMGVSAAFNIHHDPELEETCFVLSHHGILRVYFPQLARSLLELESKGGNEFLKRLSILHMFDRQSGIGLLEWRYPYLRSFFLIARPGIFLLRLSPKKMIDEKTKTMKEDLTLTKIVQGLVRKRTKPGTLLVKWDWKEIHAMLEEHDDSVDMKPPSYSLPKGIGIKHFYGPITQIKPFL